MPQTLVRSAGLAVLLGLASFMLLMGLAMGLVMLNARLTPEHAWFPLPALALALGFGVFAERRWGIGLRHPAGVPWARVYGLAFTTTVAGVCIAILQSSAMGVVRAIDTGPEGTGPQFRIAFAFVLPLFAAILAELAFRGVMQGRLHAVMRPWPAILLVTAVNTAAHPWGEGLVTQWIAYLVLLAGCGYVRWVGGSTLPVLTSHCAMNIALPLVLWNWGPFDLGALPAETRMIIAAIGVLALVATVAIARGTPPYPGPQYGYARPGSPR